MRRLTRALTGCTIFFRKEIIGFAVSALRAAIDFDAEPYVVLADAADGRTSPRRCRR